MIVNLNIKALGDIDNADELARLIYDSLSYYLELGIARKSGEKYKAVLLDITDKQGGNLICGQFGYGGCLIEDIKRDERMAQKMELSTS